MPILADFSQVGSTRQVEMVHMLGTKNKVKIQYFESRGKGCFF